ncbi:ABC transporter ATP-binding protein [Listeria floridensis FSL S10-1187]|uniref:ABC transporter ATP-binding protein n=1 Tax=Listeria floridensis FSL S10-1187 TaxID=1265817 RepID=A0ABN0RGM0_9LIST|nr:ABC-F family ATP-binding cassette domain-containing protein [Listeria floridensis]EUJ32982.1 ABC transporter ATP-binding protein [Listeria floridensis FSL S10-1187]
MKQLQVIQMTKTYGEKTLFEHADLTITEGERIGLIGVNGTGKSTLLEIISGEETSDSGERIVPKDYTIGFLKQDPEINGDLTVLEAVFQGETRSLKAIRNYEAVLLEIEQEPENEILHEKLFAAQNDMDALGAWDMNTEAKTILEKLGIQDLGQRISALSGGQKKRVGLAQVLIETPDLLILDEPTNHLDYSSIRWLEDYLNRFKGAILLVTHDRYFLDRITNHIVELANGTLYRYVGNYESFMEAKAIRLENEARESEKNRNLYRRELAWMRRGAQARSTKQKARKDRFSELQDVVTAKSDTNSLELDFSASRLGKDVFILKNVSKNYADKVILADFDLIVQPGERLGITGNNGTGKSTLLNLFAGTVEADSGTVTVGQTVEIGYYTQHNIDLDEDARLITYLQEVGNEVETTSGERISVSAMLERFLFKPETHGKKVSALSGGEKRRLFLLKILMGRPNVLLLDEPTNDLDTETLTVLEDYLESFPGTVITVSHDRYFLDKTAQKLLVFKGNGQIETYLGDYSDYLAKLNTTAAPKAEPKKKAVPEAKTVPQEKVKLTYQEKIEWQGMEDAITKAEEEISALHAELETTGSDFTKAGEISRTIEEKEAELLDLMERWEYLAQYAD